MSDLAYTYLGLAIIFCTLWAVIGMFRRDKRIELERDLRYMKEMAIQEAKKNREWRFNGGR